MSEQGWISDRAKREAGKKTTKKNPKPQCGLTFTHNTVLAWEEMDEQGQLRADQALCGHCHAGDTEVGHGVGRGVHTAKAAGDG